MDKIFKVVVPDNKSNKLISYPMRGHPLYTKVEAVELMEKFGRKCANRVEAEHKLEVWADGPGCRFTLQDYKDDFMGVRTEN